MQKRKAFTLVELLTVMSIIALLVGMVIPALSMAKKKARVVACRATISAMETGLEQFQADNGYYPSSKATYTDTSIELDMNAGVSRLNTGAHKLTEALVGYDLQGYQQDHYYEISSIAGANFGKPVDINGNTTIRSSYLPTDNLKTATLSEIANANSEVSGVGASYGYTAYGSVAHDALDAWSNYNPVIMDGLKGEYSLPFLYFKANRRGQYIESYDAMGLTGFYDFHDNRSVILGTGGFTDEYDTALTRLNHTLGNFYYYAWDPRTGSNSGATFDFDTGSEIYPQARPYKKDSYMIISAGLDQVYGTEDDICNGFEPAEGK